MEYFKEKTGFPYINNYININKNKTYLFAYCIYQIGLDGEFDPIWEWTIGHFDKLYEKYDNFLEFSTLLNNIYFDRIFYELDYDNNLTNVIINCDNDNKIHHYISSVHNLLIIPSFPDIYNMRVKEEE